MTSFSIVLLTVAWAAFEAMVRVDNIKKEKEIENIINTNQ